MDKLDQAIILILSGDEQSGQRLLGEVVTVEPQNDVAWFWLASVAPLEKRIDYLERVLHINPAHAQARAQLAQLRPVVPVQIAPQPIIGTPEYWNFPVKKGLKVILMQGENLITFLVTQDRLALVLSQVRQVVMTKEWYFANIALGTQDATYQSIPFVQMTQARLFGGSITFAYLDEMGQQRSVKIDCGKYKMADEIMFALQRHLGDGFERIFKAISRWKLAAAALLVLIVSFYVTILLLGKLMNIVLIGLGPPLLFCLIGSMFLLILSVCIIVVANPPTETLLVRKKNSGS